MTPSPSKQMVAEGERKKTGKKILSIEMKTYKRVSDIDTDKNVKAFSNVEDSAKVTPAMYRKYLKYVLRRDTELKMNHKELQKLKMAETKLDKITEMLMHMGNMTKEIIGTFFSKGIWTMYPTTIVSKSQMQSTVFNAKVFHTCAFAKDVIREFMKGD